MNLSDVLFDTGKYTLRPLAREKLAKISGIVLAYPDLKLAIEGNTDSVGSDDMNQTLSEKRASAVLDYLAQENIPAASMTSQGFGKTQPVASNDTAEGRQQNRRVELIVSGDVIGTTIGAIPQDSAAHHAPLTLHPPGRPHFFRGLPLPSLRVREEEIFQNVCGTAQLQIVTAANMQPDSQSRVYQLDRSLQSSRFGFTSDCALPGAAVRGS